MYSVNKELIIRSGSDAVDFALLKDGKLIESRNNTICNNMSKNKCSRKETK